MVLQSTEVCGGGGGFVRLKEARLPNNLAKTRLPSDCLRKVRQMNVDIGHAFLKNFFSPLLVGLRF
jgi:hypothetical protein